MTRQEALNILARCEISAGTDFFTLSSSTIDRLLSEADAVKYRKPKNANGSRGRYFYAFVTRKVDSLTEMAREMVKGRNASVRLKRNGRVVCASGPT